MKILIVEDSDDSRVLLEDQLHVHGYTVESAVNGTEALEKARKSTPDLIISDILMPEMDGFELCRQVKRDPKLRALPFIFYTATYTGPVDKHFALSLGASRFIIKPEDTTKFINTIEDVLSKHQNHELEIPDKPYMTDKALEHMHSEALTKKLDKKVHELDTQKEYLQIITDAMPVLISDIDNEYRYRYVNKAYEDWYSTSRTQIIGKHVRDIIGKEAFELVHWDMSRALNGESVTYEGYLSTHDKQERYILSKYIPHDGKKSGFSGFFELVNDITELKQAEQELQLHRNHLEELVANRTAELKASNKELEAFCYSVSHDLRSPLRSVSGFCQLLIEDYEKLLDPTALDYLTRMRSSVHRMDTLIDDLLSLSRVMRSELKQETINLSAIAKSVAEELEQNYPGRKIDYHIEQNLAAKGDASLLRVVLENLLDNAWKFTEHTPVAKIEFNSFVKDNKRVFYISDNGAGFSMSYIDKLFGAFQRLHETNDFPGTGIGLASVKRIIQRHGGEIWAQGEINKGATFYFTIPSPDESESSIEQDNKIIISKI